MRTTTSILFWFSLGLLSACSTGHLPQTTLFTLDDNPTWQAHTDHLLHLTHWKAVGRLSVSIANDATPLAFSWKNDGDHYIAQFNSTWPGGGQWHVEGSPDQVQLHQPKATNQVAKTPEALMEAALGWQAPLTHLRYWIRGLPHPNTPYTGQANIQGNILTLFQDGWEIKYGNYIYVSPEVSLPMRIIATSGNVQLKIVVQKWTH